MAITDLGADAFDRGLDEVFGGPVGFGSADIEYKVSQQFCAVAGVGDFRMKLDGPDALLLVGDAGDGVCCLGDEFKANGKDCRVITVGHPDVQRGGEACEERGLLDNRHFGVAVFAAGSALYAAAEMVRDELQAVADSEHGNAHGEHRGVCGR